MDKNRKRWGYIFDEKLDMLIPNIPRQKKFVKIFLILSLLFFIIALMQLYFLDKTSPKQIIFLIYSAGSVFFSFIFVYCSEPPTIKVAGF